MDNSIQYVSKEQLEKIVKQEKKQLNFFKKINHSLLLLAFGAILFSMYLFAKHHFSYAILPILSIVLIAPFGILAENRQNSYASELKNYDELTDEKDFQRLKNLLNAHPELNEYKKNIINEKRQWTPYDLSQLINYSYQLNQKNKNQNLNELKK